MSVKVDDIFSVQNKPGKYFIFYFIVLCVLFYFILFYIWFICIIIF